MTLHALMLPNRMTTEAVAVGIVYSEYTIPTRLGSELRRVPRGQGSLNAALALGVLFEATRGFRGIFLAGWEKAEGV